MKQSAKQPSVLFSSQAGINTAIGSIRGLNGAQSVNDHICLE